MQNSGDKSQQPTTQKEQKAVHGPCSQYKAIIETQLQQIEQFKGIITNQANQLKHLKEELAAKDKQISRTPVSPRPNKPLETAENANCLVFPRQQFHYLVEKINELSDMQIADEDIIRLGDAMASVTVRLSDSKAILSELKNAENEINRLKQQLKAAKAETAAQKTAASVQIEQMREIHRKQLESQQKKFEAQNRADAEQMNYDDIQQQINELTRLNQVLQDANQCLQVENLVCMAKLSGQPMEAVVTALQPMKVNLRADQEIFQYYQKYSDAAQRKAALSAAKKVQEFLRQRNLVQEQEHEYNVEAVVKRGQTVISPDKATQQAVAELQREFLKHGVELRIEWRRIANQSDKSDIYSWHIGDKPLNLVVIRGKLFVVFGATNIEVMDYMSNYLQ